MSSYIRELEKKLTRKKIQLQEINDLIHLQGTLHVDFLKNVSLRNSLTVDVETIKQRISNLGKFPYMPNYDTSSINQSNI